MLRYAILTLLADEPRSGYDLSKVFSASLTYVWPARQSQIYPELHRLEGEGLVEATTVAQSSKPDKHIYRLTTEGRHALEEWVATPLEPPSFRDAFQLRALNFGRVDVDTALSLLAQQKAYLMQRMELFEQVVGMLEAGGHRPGEPLNPNVGWRIALEAGLRVHRAYRDWCDWATAQLTASGAASKRSRPARGSTRAASTPRGRKRAKK
jgi:DNA-binding PadR family transcriptional regulator